MKVKSESEVAQSCPTLSQALEFFFFVLLAFFFSVWDGIQVNGPPTENEMVNVIDDGKNTRLHVCQLV